MAFFNVIYLCTLIIAHLRVCASPNPYSATDNETGEQRTWMWIAGNSVGNQKSSITSDARESSVPGGRTGSATWTDAQGNLWMFGGKGFDDKPTESPHCLDDLWLFNVTTEQWSVVSPGSNQPTSAQRSSAQRHIPKGRQGGVICGVEDIMLVLYSGEDSAGRRLPDTWVFEIPGSRWIPMFMTAHPGQNKTVHPPGRMSPAHWCLQDRLIIFSGVGLYGEMLDDMWQFSLQSLTWKRLPQHIQINQFSGDMSPFPEPRHGAVTWKDKHGQLYLFGGSTEQSSATAGLHKSASFLSNMWRYDLQNSTWMLTNVTKTKATRSGSNTMQPQARQYAASFGGKDGYLWLFGGEGMSRNSQMSCLFSDLWQYNIINNVWVLSDSNAEVHNETVYMGRNVLLEHLPVTARSSSIVWTYRNLTYFFGGFGYDGRGHLSYLNDQWVLLKGDPRDYILSKLTAKTSWIKSLSPGKIFLLIFGGFGGLVFSVGCICFTRKVFERPRGSGSEFRVKYTRVSTQESMEM